MLFKTIYPYHFRNLFSFVIFKYLPHKEKCHSELNIVHRFHLSKWLEQNPSISDSLIQNDCNYVGQNFTQGKGRDFPSLFFVWGVKMNKIRYLGKMTWFHHTIFRLYTTKKIKQNDSSFENASFSPFECTLLSYVPGWLAIIVDIILYGYVKYLKI